MKSTVNGLDTMVFLGSRVGEGKQTYKREKVKENKQENCFEQKEQVCVEQVLEQVHLFQKSYVMMDVSILQHRLGQE